MPRTIDPNGFGFLISDLARLIRADFDRVIAEAGIGITPGEARALAHAARAGSVRQNVLAERMGVEAMTVTGFLDRLEAKGLVRRMPDPDDRRAKLVELTDTADAVLTKVQDAGNKTRAAAAAGIVAGDWDAFLTTLLKLHANLTSDKPDVSPRVQTS